MACKLLFLLKLLLYFSHFFTNSIIGAHCQAFSYELNTKDKEKAGGCKMRKTFREEGWDSVTEHSGEHSHDNQGGEGCREDDKTRMSHSHQGSDKEGLVSNFGEDNHSE